LHSCRTGGASGIGQAFVEAFAMQKANVAFLDIDNGTGLKLTTKLTKAGATTPGYPHCDQTDIADVQRTIRKILQRFGTVDVLVNNAGNDTRHKVAEVTPTYWDKTIAVVVTENEEVRSQFPDSQFWAVGEDPVTQRISPSVVQYPRLKNYLFTALSESVNSAGVVPRFFWQSLAASS
jgi:NAD(P)-dependent dehydrogenase (short-subunit alcohol dehydrogenase family)